LQYAASQHEFLSGYGNFSGRAALRGPAVGIFTAEDAEVRRGFPADIAAAGGGSDYGGCFIFIRYRIRD
jgi:hypothetical protein